jgi:hypothetical protein
MKPVFFFSISKTALKVIPILRFQTFTTVLRSPHRKVTVRAQDERLVLLKRQAGAERTFSNTRRLLGHSPRAPQANGKWRRWRSTMGDRN